MAEFSYLSITMFRLSHCDYIIKVTRYYLRKSTTYYSRYFVSERSLNWFLHTMLFYHTQYVINKQMKTDEEDEEDAESDDEIQCTTICIFQKKIISYMH